MARFNRFGDTRLEAEQGGFFRWFMLDPVAGETPAPGRRVAHYRPNGPAYHDLTELVITTDSSDALLKLELRLTRRFIDHPHDGLFARDIAKSLLRDGLGDADAETLAGLINEIEFPREVKVPVITARTAEILLPGQPTPGYQTYLGTRGRFDRRCLKVDVVAENYVRDGAPWFRLALAVRPAPWSGRDSNP